MAKDVWLQKALEEISQKKGLLYDPEVVQACIRLFTEKGFKFEQSLLLKISI